jgi:hypothetical protein
MKKSFYFVTNASGSKFEKAFHSVLDAYVYAGKRQKELGDKFKFCHPSALSVKQLQVTFDELDNILEGEGTVDLWCDNAINKAFRQSIIDITD